MKSPDFPSVGKSGLYVFLSHMPFRSLANLLYTVGVIPITFLKAIMKLVEEL